ncbi:hypothetical protein EJ110_NYTH39435 [Nymphaea thermarum]|nr:hypothetical protein EJ110_NYTH39435 [Nymphaea thermarum]
MINLASLIDVTVKDSRSDHTERGVGYISSTNNERAVGYISSTKYGTTLACNPSSCKEDVTERGNLIESVKTGKKARSIAHHLKVAGKKVEEEDLILHTLCGLPPQYEAMRVSISIRKDPVSMTELLSLLLSHEAYLGEGDSVEKASDSQVEANVTHRTNQGSGNQYYGRENYRGGRGGRFRS